MRRLAILVALFLLIVTASPMLACVTGETMTPQESACCREMHGNCGDMAKMGCCNKKVATDAHPQFKTTIAPLLVNHTTIAESFSQLDRKIESPMPTWVKAPYEHPPPGLLIVETTNLRI